MHSIIQRNELLYTQECIKSGWVSSSGKYVEIFEEMIVKYTGQNTQSLIIA